MKFQPQRSAWVLVIEDDDDDFLLLGRAFEESGNRIPLLRATDGEGLIPALEEAVSAPGAVYPRFVLMDLRMPRKDGRESLRELKAHPDFCKIPALVLTTSKYHGDVNRSYLEGANTFFSKPADYPSLVAMVGIICDYWFNTALHPAPDTDRPRTKENGS